MGRIFITPLAKKLASLNSLNIKDITGTGPRGRITRIDIEKHLKLASSNTNTEQKNNMGQVNGIDHEVINIPKIRQIIAEKLTLSKSSIPHFYLRRKARVDELINFRNKTNDLLEKNNKISINDFFIKASALANQNKVNESRETLKKGMILMPRLTLSSTLRNPMYEREDDISRLIKGLEIAGLR